MSFQTAMEVMQFSKEEVREVLRLLAGILHLGNIEFITAGGAQVSFKTGEKPALPCSMSIFLEAVKLEFTVSISDRVKDIERVLLHFRICKCQFKCWVCFLTDEADKSSLLDARSQLGSTLSVYVYSINTSEIAL